MRLFVILFSVASFISLNEANPDDVLSGPTIVAKPCNEADDVEAIHKIVTNDKNDNNDVFYSLVDLIAKRTNAQRRSIAAVYKTKYNEDLSSKLFDYFKNYEDTSSNDVGKNLQELLRTPAEFLATRIEHSLKRAKGENGDRKDKGFLSILCTSTGEELKNISDVYPQIEEKKKSLTERLDKLVPDKDSKNFLMYLVDPKGNFRSNSKADDKKTKDLLAVIPDQKKGPCKGQPLIDLFAKESFDQIKAVGMLYESQKHVPLFQKIVDSCEGQLATTYVWILKFAMNSSCYFADEIHSFLHYHEGDPFIESEGTRVVISRSEIDLADIRQAYLQKFGARLTPEMQYSDIGALNGYLMAKLIDGNR